MTQTVLLGDVCLQITDGTHSTVKDNPNGDFLLLSAKNIKDRVVTSNNERKIDKETLMSLRKRTKTALNDVLVTSVGTIGETAIIKDVSPNYEFQRSVLILKPNTEQINPDYLYYYMRSMKHEFISMATGAVQKCLFIGQMKNVSVELPDIESQKKTANILGSIDEKIELNRQMNETLEQMGQALFRHYFIDNPEAEKWEEVALPSLIEFIGGSQPPKSEHIYEEKDGYVRFVQNRDYASDSHKTYIPIAKRNKLCNETDIMMDKYGEAGRVRFGIAGAYNVALAKIVPKKENMQEYLRAYFSMPQTQRSLESAAAASTRSSLNATTFAGFKVKMPSDELLIDFDNSHKDILHKIMANAEQIQTLTTLRDTLLPRLISGKVRV